MYVHVCACMFMCVNMHMHVLKWACAHSYAHMCACIIVGRGRLQMSYRGGGKWPHRMTGSEARETQRDAECQITEGTQKAGWGKNKAHPKDFLRPLGATCQ